MPKVVDGVYEVHAPVPVSDVEAPVGVEMLVVWVVGVFEARPPSFSRASARTAADSASTCAVEASVSWAWLRSAGVRDGRG